MFSLLHKFRVGVVPALTLTLLNMIGAATFFFAPQKFEGIGVALAMFTAGIVAARHMAIWEDVDRVRVPFSNVYEGDPPADRSDA